MDKTVELNLMSVFSENMVLQRDMPIKIWGTCTGAEYVTVHFSGQEARAHVLDNHWEVMLPSMPANENAQEMKITAGDKAVVLNKVYIGDVWLCGGQSNMDAPISYLPDELRDQYNSYKAIRNIRYFRVNRTQYDEPLSEFTESCYWSIPSETEMPNYSAYAYGFATRLASFINIPIGIIDSAYGGTTIEQWMPKASLENAGANFIGSMYYPI